MKIILIALPKPHLRQPDAQAPLGLMYLASVLENNNYDVGIIDFQGITDEEAVGSLEQAEVYGITTTSLELLHASRFAKKIKEKYPKSKIILGGPGTHTNEYIDLNVIDSYIQGEAEVTILKIIEDIKNSCLATSYKGEAVIDLDTIPFPARYLLRNQGGNIFAYDKNYKGGGSTIIITSRGCPFNCSFCGSSQWSQKVRHRSPENVYKEIVDVVATFGIKQFRFSDDLFMCDKERVLKICDLVGNLNIAWRISTRVKPFDEDIAKVMFEAGCKEVSFGVESFDNHVLKVLQKGTTATDNAKALEVADRVGMKSRVLFMIKTPGQTRETVPTNIEWLKRVPYNIIACTTFVPIPGCDIWKNPEKYDVEIINRNLDDYNFYFFGKQGENELKDITKLNGRTLDEVNKESQMFRDYLKSTGKLNEG